MDEGEQNDGEDLQELVWVVDNRDEVIERVGAVLRGDDRRVESFTDARKAVLHARREMPDLIVLGLAENTIDPDKLLALRGEFEEVADVPVIAIFSDDDVVTIEEVIDQGVVDAVALERLEAELDRRASWHLRRRDARSGPRQGGLSNRKLSALRTFEFLTRVIEASPNAIVAARRDGEIVLFNPAAEKILGWSQAEALGMSVRRLYPSGGAKRIMKLIRSSEEGEPGKIESLREVVVHRKGELIPVEISAALVHEDGQEVATVGVFTDLRQQMKMEERLQEAMEAIEETQRQAVVAEVAGAAAHELNQPLTSLLGYVEYLRRNFDESDGVYRAVSTIHDDATRIAEVVRKIGRVTRYRTRDYAGGNQIVDLEEASSVEEVHHRGDNAPASRQASRITQGEGD